MYDDLTGKRPIQPGLAPQEGAIMILHFVLFVSIIRKLVTAVLLMAREERAETHSLLPNLFFAFFKNNAYTRAKMSFATSIIISIILRRAQVLLAHS